MSLDQLAKETFEVLGKAGIPAEIIGGYALAHYGYVRNTVDIDVIVRDHQRALEVLKAHGLQEGDHWFTVVDPKLPGLAVDVLPGGRVIGGNTQTNPMPQTVATVPAFISLKDLIRLKLGVVVYNRPRDKVVAKNEADVGYLISKNHLPRTFMDGCADQVIRFEFGEIWDRNSPAAKQSSLLDPFADFFDVGSD